MKAPAPPRFDRCTVCGGTVKRLSNGGWTHDHYTNADHPVERKADR